MERQDYSFINYFQNCNYLPFEATTILQKKNKDLNALIYEKEKKANEEILKLQKKITELQNIEVNKIEVEGRTYMSCNINVNCPFCDSWQEVKETDDWHPGESFEGNQECASCGKIFSVKSDGEY